MHWAEARQAARDAVKPLEAVELPLADALGMALASPVRAGGAPHPSPLTPGTAVEIATGAPVPPGTRAVLPALPC
ncbi:MAG TPA: hypothetical protein VGH57_06855 [Amycolatopsis sp.]